METSERTQTVTPNNGTVGRESPIPEGPTTRAIEQTTARVPSAAYLWIAGGAMVASAALYLAGKKQAGIFVGLWPISFLTIGNYNKLVKTAGST